MGGRLAQVARLATTSPKKRRVPLQSAVELGRRHRRCEVSTDVFAEIGQDHRDGDRIDAGCRVKAGLGGREVCGTEVLARRWESVVRVVDQYRGGATGKEHTPMRRRREGRVSVRGGRGGVVHGEVVSLRVGGRAVAAGRAIARASGADEDQGTGTTARATGSGGIGRVAVVADLDELLGEDVEELCGE